MKNSLFYTVPISVRVETELALNIDVLKRAGVNVTELYRRAIRQAVEQALEKLPVTIK